VQINAFFNFYPECLSLYNFSPGTPCADQRVLQLLPRVSVTVRFLSRVHPVQINAFFNFYPECLSLYNEFLTDSSQRLSAMFFSLPGTPCADQCVLQVLAQEAAQGPLRGRAPIFQPGWRLMKPMLKSYASLVRPASVTPVYPWCAFGVPLVYPRCPALHFYVGGTVQYSTVQCS